MATYTDNYNLVKPTMAETADIRTINGNMDVVDDIMHASQISLAPAYDQNETYNTGDVVMYEFLMYECLDDDVTGTWDSTKWQRTTAGEHGGGSDVEITPTLATGTKIADFEIDGVSGELYAPSGGGGASYVELTQAEYNALTPAEKMNGTMYFITDAGGSGGGVFLAPMIYSTEEREVGAWVDDKPLYQKSYLLSTPIEIKNNGVVVSSYIDNYQDIECFVRGQASYTDSSYGKQGSDIWVGFSSTNIMVFCAEGCMANVITLWYTKTADVAGSGSYGSLGIPMEHYDDTERVVGTYFGDTLYKKTIPNISITGTTTTIQTGVNIGTLVAVEATGYKIDGGGNIIRFKEPYNDGGDRLDVEGINNDIRVICSSWFNGSTIDITIKYTKSST